MRSLRGRLTLWLLTGMGLLLAAGGLVLNQVISSRLHREYDAALLARAYALKTMTEQQGRTILLESPAAGIPEFSAQEKPDYFQIWLTEGPVVMRSRSLGSRDLPRPGGLTGQPRWRDLTLPDGRKGRQVEIRFRPHKEEEEVGEVQDARMSRPPNPASDLNAILAVAHGREDLDAFLTSVHVTLALVVLGLLAGTALLVKAVVGVGLAPLDHLANRLDEMDAESLGTAMTVADAPVELVPLIRHLEGLLARLNASFARERAFSANLAHELRTPLAELRTLADVALKWPEDSSSWLTSFEEVRAIGMQMETVVGNLLALARHEAGQLPVQTSEVRLRELAASCWSPFSAEATDKGMELRLGIPDDLTLVTDREKLALILSNLFSNALTYGSPGCPVACSAAVSGAGFDLRVRNCTTGLAPEDLPRLFDRFWRKDPARSGGHTGLGLSLVAALCETLGLQKEARLDGGAFEIILRGPVAPEKI